MEKQPGRIRPIFDRALEIDGPNERTAYLAEACAGDQELRLEVEGLLRAHDRAGDFLARPAIASLADATEALDRRDDGKQAALPPHLLATGAEQRDDEQEISLNFLQPPAMPDSLGRLGHYEVLEVIGRGGFGVVLKGFDEKLHRVVAIKVMAPELAVTSPARKRFLREARSAAAIRNEHVVQIYAVEEQPIPYLVMEYIAGETLQQRIDRTGPLAVQEVLRIGGQVARGLAAAHATGLIHRDVKPGNVLLENGASKVKITDFGLARTADDASVTQSGVVAGTPMYMAPEQARGEAIDHRADLFSLGSVLYVMCSGRPPFRASTTLAVLKRVAEDAPRPIREIIPDVPEWLCAIVARLHAKDPDKRFASAKDVADLLGRHLAEQQQDGGVQSPDLVPPTAAAPPAPEARSKPRPRWLIPLLGGTALLTLLGLLGFVFIPGLLPRGPTPTDPKAPVVFRVAADRVWQDTGVDVAEGESVVLAPEGTWRKGEQVGSAGGLEEAPRERAVLPDAPLLCLLARVGDEPTPTPVRGLEVIKPKRGGRLFVQANDLDLDGDSGGLQVTITGGRHVGDAAPSPQPTPDQVADRDWQPLLDRVAAAGARSEPARDAVFDYCVKYAGTAHAFRAASMLLKAPPLVNGVGMKLAAIPPGRFVMGSPEDEPGRWVDEGPRHEVVFTRPFYLGVCDVTVGQYRAFVRDKGYMTEAEMKGGASRLRDGVWRLDPLANWLNPGFPQTDDQPVVDVSWKDAVAYCDWLSEKEGKTYTLPTEAQWEYACRAGARTKYFFGNDDQELTEYAWNAANSGNQSRPVGGKKPNAWGLYDMHGNVFNWTADWYAKGYYQNSPREDPTGPPGGVARVTRGGSWEDGVRNCRCAVRGYCTLAERYPHLGFRVVLLP